jgi:hypothetical protein
MLKNLSSVNFGEDEVASVAIKKSKLLFDFFKTKEYSN